MKWFLILLWFISFTAFASCPQNASLVDGRCLCNENFKVQQGRCVHQFIKPRIVHGYSFCDNGYVNKGDYCEAIYVPLNAHAIGNSWTCDVKYKRVGNTCEPKTYEELSSTLDMFLRIASQNQCDSFLSSCKSECNSRECYAACEEGKDHCESLISDICYDARSECESKCYFIRNSSERSACESACAEGESACE